MPKIHVSSCTKFATSKRYRVKAVNSGIDPQDGEWMGASRAKITITSIVANLLSEISRSQTIQSLVDKSKNALTRSN